MIKILEFHPMTCAWAVAGGIAGAWFFGGIGSIALGFLIGTGIGFLLDRPKTVRPR